MVDDLHDAAGQGNAAQNPEHGPEKRAPNPIKEHPEHHAHRKGDQMLDGTFGPLKSHGLSRRLRRADMVQPISDHSQKNSHHNRSRCLPNSQSIIRKLLDCKHVAGKG
jgi:hypothetical protein